LFHVVHFPVHDYSIVAHVIHSALQIVTLLHIIHLALYDYYIVAHVINLAL